MPKLSTTHQYKGTYYGPDSDWDQVPKPVQEADLRISGRAKQTVEAVQVADDVLMIEDVIGFPHADKLLNHDPPIRSVQEAQSYPDHLLLKINGIGEAGLNAIKNWKPPQTD